MVRARVLVSDAETAAGLAVVRSLVRAGHRVGVLAWSRHAAAAASRGVRYVLDTHRPDENPGAWVGALARHLGDCGFDVFLPVTDTAILLSSRILPVLEALTRPALPSPETLDLVMDKRAVLARARSLGIPVLPARTPASLDGAPFPAVLKPGRSRVYRDGVVRRATARVVADREELHRRAGALRRAGLGGYVEPWIPGEGRGIFLLLHRGRVLATFAHRRIREASPLGGPSAVCEAVDPDPELLEAAAALARDLGAEGPFMAEFRGEPGEYVLLEVNARYWGSLSLAVDAGVDFPALHVRALLGDPAPGPSAWTAGLRRRNLAFDLRHAARALAGPPRGLEELPWPGRLRTLRDLLLERAGGMFARRGDPAPARAHLLHLAAELRRHA